MKSAAITGAAGFIGRTLRERLLSESVTVRGVDFAADAERDILAGDIAEAGDWAAAFEGADTVFHTAAVVSNAATREQQWRVNVLGTRNVIDAAVAAGVERIVHFSSIRAFGDLGFPDGVEESYPVRPDGSHYVDTKIASEQVALQAHAAGRIETTVIRPGDVYGPGSRPWTIMIVEAIESGQFLLPAMGRGIFSPVYVDNLVDGVLLAARRDEGSGQIFTLSDGLGVPCRDFFGHYFRMLGKRGPICVPTPVAIAAVSGPELGAKLRRRPTEINRESMRYFTRTGTYSIAKARTLLGYEPAVDLDEGMRRTEAWLRETNLI